MQEAVLYTAGARGRRARVRASSSGVWYSVYGDKFHLVPAGAAWEAGAAELAFALGGRDRVLAFADRGYFERMVAVLGRDCGWRPKN